MLVPDGYLPDGHGHLRVCRATRDEHGDGVVVVINLREKREIVVFLSSFMDIICLPQE